MTRTAAAKTIAAALLAGLVAAAAWLLVGDLVGNPVISVTLLLKTPDGRPVFRPDALPREELPRLVPWVTIINSGRQPLWIRDVGIAVPDGASEKRHLLIAEGDRPARLPGGRFLIFRVHDIRRTSLRPGAKTYVRDLLGREFRSDGSDIARIYDAYRAAAKTGP